MSYKTIIPDPSRLIEGLRDTGYSFNTAIADIVDNSVVAKAKNIYIEIELDLEGKVQLRILDDGYGMNSEDLLDAMKYGSKPKADAKSLSKFGLGLKTGSTAFCRRLSVISKSESEIKINKATWDLDIVASEGKWIVDVNEPDSEEIDIFNRVANKGSGTVIIWNNIDRLLKKYANPGGKDALKAIDKYILSLKEHLSMVFQRFLDHEDERARSINIYVNNDKLEHWDPFCENNDNTDCG